MRHTWGAHKRQIPSVNDELFEETRCTPQMCVLIWVQFHLILLWKLNETTYLTLQRRWAPYSTIKHKIGRHISSVTLRCNMKTLTVSLLERRAQAWSQERRSLRQVHRDNDQFWIHVRSLPRFQKRRKTQHRTRIKQNSSRTLGTVQSRANST